MGLFSSLFVFTVLRDALLLILWLASLAGLGGLDRAAAGLGLVGGDAGAGRHHRGLRQRAPARRVVTVDVPIAGLPPDLDGFTIVQISDIHVGPTIKQRYVQAIVDAVNQNRRTSSPSPATWSTAASNSWPRRPARWASCARLMACIW